MMTMHNNHISHWHWPEWETFKSNANKVLRDPRFWTVLIVAGAFLLMLFAAIFTEYGTAFNVTPDGQPLYPMWP